MLEDEVDVQHPRLDYLDHAGIYLLMKSQPSDAALIQLKMDHFHDTYQQLLARLAALTGAKPLHKMTTQKVPLHLASVLSKPNGDHLLCNNICLNISMVISIHHIYSFTPSRPAVEFNCLCV